MPCFPSIARAEKNSSALQGRWLEEPEGFPTHVSFRKGNKTAIMAAARGTKRPLWPPQGEQKGHYGRRKGNKRAIMAAARGTKRPLWPPQGEQNGHYGRRKGNKTAIMAAARGTKRPLWPPQGEQKGRYAPVGVRPPPPLRGLSPCEAGQFIPAGFDCRHSEACKSRDSVSLNSRNSFFQMALNPQECGLFRS